MKCPKCGYLGFEPVERCRHCGYDFSLSQSESIPEWPIRPDAGDMHPLGDLALVDAAASGGRAAQRDDLPLFGAASLEDDQPLITRPSPPRTPLAVRRSTPEVPRLRSEPPRMASLDLGLELEAAPSAGSSSSPEDRARAGRAEPAANPGIDAGVGARLLAVALDLVILAVVDGLVVYFTMKICGLTIAETGLLPKGPLLAFLLVQNGGYLVAFTAGGQTLGKMAVGIKVVTAESPSSIDLGRAFLRELLWILLAVPAGLGFLTILTSDHRGLHDRFAGTRVVR